MKFALVNGERTEPAPGLIGSCTGCGNPTIAKCGNIKVHHWAHKSKLECDPWWENETEWHRSLKEHFPEPWQEVVHRADNGEFHRADVKTAKGWVIEIQYSAIHSDERSSRNTFYQKLVWIVYGPRRKRDPVQFFQSLKLVKTLENSFFRKIYDVTPNSSALLRDWRNDKSPVFFDFNHSELFWCLLPRSADGKAIVFEIARQTFIDAHLSSANSSQDIFGDLMRFAANAKSAEDLFLKLHQLKKEEERRKQLMADEARRRNPYINRRANFRF